MKSFEPLNNPLGRKLYDKAKDHFFGGVAEEMKKEGMKALHRRLDSYLQALHVMPVYTKEGTEGFADMRKKLNTEAGVVIANHPGYLDIASILKCIDRNDVKIMVTARLYKDLAAVIGEEYLVPAIRNSQEIVSVMRAIEAHIASGGLFIIFPSGGHKQQFKNGFSFILQRLSPDKMIYAFHFNETEVGKLVGMIPEPLRHVGLASELLISSSANINRLSHIAPFRVDEDYSTAAEWQQVCDSEGSRRNNRAALTKHFYGLFPPPSP